MYTFVFFILIPIIIIGAIILASFYPTFISTYFGDTAGFIGVLTVLLTYVYVVLTGRMVWQMKQTSEDESRPYVIVDIIFEEFFGFFTLKNIGKLPAENVLVRINPDIVTDVVTEGLNNSLFEKPIALVPPNKEIKTFIVSGEDSTKETFPKVFHVELQYQWKNHESVTENYIIDTNYTDKVIFLSPKNIEDVAEALEKISKAFESVVKSGGIHIKTSDDIEKERERIKELRQQIAQKKEKKE